ncbi:hypothetical protein T02_15196 [Trichinella nativa]|uniref:Uncharacterized protein n=1 Tax=Trichinella nativa TaxID=6335 RepID=A0A0V1LCI6_9BILA|nr:hypothetical protein T02_15196 [Trichinella nativa]
MKKIKTLRCTEIGCCELEIGLRLHRFCDFKTDQPVQTCLEVKNFRFHACTVQQGAYKASAGRMNSSGKYSRKFDIRDSA